HVLLKVPRKDNMYSVDLKNVIPQGGITYLYKSHTVGKIDCNRLNTGSITVKSDSDS
ncbi:hypothetical protein Tco_0380447, partial [Tanacetum coccineum]